MRVLLSAAAMVAACSAAPLGLAKWGSDTRGGISETFSYLDGTLTDVHGDIILSKDDVMLSMVAMGPLLPDAPPTAEHLPQKAEAPARQPTVQQDQQGTVISTDGNSSIVYRPSTDSCVKHTDGQLLCTQDRRAPKCPVEFFTASLKDCYVLASLLNKHDASNTTIQLQWWASPDCLVHRMFCVVNHAKHAEQYQSETYDFQDVCDEVAHVHMEFAFNIYNEAAQHTVSRYFHSSKDMAHGDKVLLLSMSEKTAPVYREYGTMYLYERNSVGQITYSTKGMDQLNIDSPRGDMTGLYAQHKKEFVQYYNGKPHGVPYIFNYRVTHVPVIGGCPEDKENEWISLYWNEKLKRRRSHGGSSDVPIIIGVIGAVLAVALVSFGVHYYMMKRKQFFAEKAEIHARHIEVAAREMHPPQPVPGIVEGVVLGQHQSSGAAGETDECSAAPLPPPQPPTGYPIVVAAAPPTGTQC